MKRGPLRGVTYDEILSLSSRTLIYDENERELLNSLLVLVHCLCHSRESQGRPDGEGHPSVHAATWP